MEKGDYITAILNSKKTVFTFKDVTLLWGQASDNASRVRISYYVRTGRLIRLRRGIYAKDKNYNRLELATKIFTPAYVSFETVLVQEGIVFQHYDRIFVASYLTRDIKCDNQIYSFRRLNQLLITNHLGIENKEEYSIATKERAFLDILYVNKDYHFDNLSPLNWDKVFELLPTYHNRRMDLRIKEIYKHFQENQ
ncbi:MAG: type IV toxin-antitoxin system AbiEi family antitoxin domain-containing protein [Gammaproteobacteria bacterium]